MIERLCVSCSKSWSRNAPPQNSQNQHGFHRVTKLRHELDKDRKAAKGSVEEGVERTRRNVSTTEEVSGVRVAEDRAREEKHQERNDVF